MTTVVLGSNGMLGRAFARFYSKAAILINRECCDFTDFDKLQDVLAEIPFSTLINCAGQIDLSKIEADYETHFTINTLLPGKLARWCLDKNIQFVHISTDHFYDDQKQKHTETDPITIVNAYAKQKYLAEQLVEFKNPNALILRTSLLGYRIFDGRTLVEWILKTLKNERQIKGYVDSYTSSLDVRSFCFFADAAIRKRLYGVFNLASQDVYSKYDLVKAIAGRLGLSDREILLGTCDELTPPRAKNCGLDSTQIETILQTKLPSFQDVIDNLELSEAYSNV